MAKFKLITNAVKTVGEFIAPELLTEATKLVNKQVEKRNDYIKIPNVKQLPIEEAKEILSQFDLIVSTILLPPSIKLANARTNSVLKVTPHSALAVPPKTLVKIFYINEEIAIESKILKQKFEENKSLKKQSHSETIHKVTKSLKESPRLLKKKVNSKRNKY